jgi:hypothetical protein
VESWVPLVGYPGYSVSTTGKVRNDRREHVLTPMENAQHRPFVKLTKDGVQVSRGLALLVSSAFIPQRTGWNTPIHFDGDLMNCHVDNLDWRPRWFAIRHTEQFRMDIPEDHRPVRELSSRRIYNDAWSVVFACGLLYMELIRAIAIKTYVFPNMQTYEWA